MHSALLFIDMLDISQFSGKENWTAFLADIADARSEPNAEKLSENCWLIPLESDASYLSELVHAATSHRLAHRILFLDREPEWVGTWKMARNRRRGETLD